MVEGRWPANVILDPAMTEALDQQSGISGGGKKREGVARARNNGIGLGTIDSRSGAANSPDNYGDEGGASRYFFQAGYEPWELDWIYANGLRPYAA